MKILLPVLRALSLTVLVGSLGRGTCAQDKDRLPPGLSQSSPHAEIMEWLDRNSFADARVGLSHGGSPAMENADGSQEPSRLAERFVFSQGFRLANLEGCALTLRNDDVKLLYYDDNALFTIGGGGVHTFYEVGKTGTRYVAELYVPLHRMSETKGRAAYRHTRDPKKAALLGAWRTTFKPKGRGHVGISIFPAGQREKQNYVPGQTLTFTFDTREAGEKFNAAFRRAIKLCAEK